MLFLRLSVSFVFFFKRKTAYEMRISDWSSDVCSSDLSRPARARRSASLAFSADCWLSDICSNSSRLLELRSARTAGERLSHHAFCLAISDLMALALPAVQLEVEPARYAARSASTIASWRAFAAEARRSTFIDRGLVAALQRPSSSRVTIPAWLSAASAVFAVACWLFEGTSSGFSTRPAFTTRSRSEEHTSELQSL